ncbi:Spy/CpxP family protein refolding chaperone [Sulfurimonas sp.]|uniref:Spy/CpxP family protein refolding chaperone n=1 Tax=Sulfurimonas sp. TaxID=2022749 RepID=UPI00261C4AC8|nr:Spy/CpxP family protein refolding chaperone [Sulfurimonas sp.]MCW8896130.1 Spy/CpxP family protein refolding chaperone [Sulfurimonas sp.]
MNTKIILSLGATALLASSLLAFSPQSGKGQGNNAGCNQQKMMKGQGHRGNKGLVKMFMKLDLSDKQRAEVKAIVKASMESMPKPHSAFSDDSFDKKAFIKLAKEKRDGKIKRRAEMIEKIYKVLDSSQKKDFKTMLDMRQLMKKNMMLGGGQNAKNCNGRR